MATKIDKDTLSITSTIKRAEIERKLADDLTSLQRNANQKKFLDARIMESQGQLAILDKE